MTIIEQLKQARLDANLSTRKASEIIGIDHSYLAKIEKGQHIASIDLIQKIAEAYGKKLTLEDK